MLKIKLETIGADPEFAIVDKDGKPTASFIFFEGTKRMPEDFGGGYQLLRDNLLVEANIPPARSTETFVKYMKTAKKIIMSQLEKSGAKIIFQDVVEYEDQFIYSPDGQEFGCSSSVDIYEEAMVPTPILEGNKRSVGAHIHIGYKFESDDDDLEMSDINIQLGKALDFFIGIPSDEINFSEDRRSNYGKLGSIRHTIYGMEYRSLGGFFLQDEFLEWQAFQVKKAIAFINEGDNFEKLKTVKEANKDYYEFLGINLEAQVPTKKVITK